MAGDHSGSESHDQRQVDGTVGIPDRGVQERDRKHRHQHLCGMATSVKQRHRSGRQQDISEDVELLGCAALVSPPARVVRSASMPDGQMRPRDLDHSDRDGDHNITRRQPAQR